MPYDRDIKDARAAEIDSLTGASGGRGSTEDVNVLRAIVQELLSDRTSLLELVDSTDTNEVAEELIHHLTDENASLQAQIDTLQKEETDAVIIPAPVTPAPTK